MASEGKILCFFYMYLLLSVDPINASRIKTAGRVIAKAQETEKLVKELQKALNENHMHDLFVQNETAMYIGETWATCAGRKADFERRTMKVKQRYDAAVADGTITTVESGWVILKVRSLAMTVATAAKQGCEWVHDQSANMTVMEGMLNETSKSVPCRDAAMASLEDARSKDREPTQDELANAFSIMFSDAKDCKPHEVQPKNHGKAEVLAADEKAEADAADLANEFKKNREDAQKPEGAQSLAAIKDVQKLQKQGTTQAIASLLQKVSQQTESSVVITVSGIISLMIGLVIAILLCTVALILWVLILGLVWCLFKAIISKLLEILDRDDYDADFVECADEWIDWVKTRHDDEGDVIDVSAALCIITSLAGHPIAGFGPHGLFLNVPNTGAGYHPYRYQWWW